MDGMQTYREVANSEALIANADMLHKEGYRLAQACVAGKDRFELLYTFERDNRLIHLRLRIREDETVESVSGIYPYAYLYENEMKDLFGVVILHINVDFGGKLYSTVINTPFAAGVDKK